MQLYLSWHRNHGIRSKVQKDDIKRLFVEMTFVISGKKQYFCVC